MIDLYIYKPQNHKGGLLLPPYTPFKKGVNLNDFYLKKTLCLSIMNTTAQLTPEGKAEIFDIVNSMYLHYKGDKKKNTKKAFKSLWKEDNNCYRLILSLYNADDILQKNKDIFNKELEYGYGIPLDWETKKISFRRHHGMISMLRQEVEDLEKQLENIEQEKDIIKMTEHNDIIRQIENQYKEKLEALEDNNIKLKNQLRDKESLHSHKIAVERSRADQFKDQVNKLISSSSD